MSNLKLKPKNVLIRPHITEKAAIAADKANVYTFEVTKDATKRSVAISVRDAYKVTPIKVNVAKIPKENVFIRGKRGVKSGGKKAYVYLKKGDKIELI